MIHDTSTLYLLAGAALLQRIIAVNVMGNGVFLVFITLAARGEGDKPDPVPHAMVLTGIVVAVCATALALTLSHRWQSSAGEKEEEHS